MFHVGSYFEFIQKHLNLLAMTINQNGKMNLLNHNLRAEVFYSEFFNILYGYALENMNKHEPNAEAIDLIDKKKHIIIQVSAMNTKRKVQTALAKDKLAKYHNYSFKFISISKDATSLKDKNFANPHSLLFDPSKDIHDVNSIIDDIRLLGDLDKVKEIYRFVKSQIGLEIDFVKLDSNLATIINILSKENWENQVKAPEIKPFEIQRKIDFNQLVKVKPIIEEYSPFHGRVTSKYSEFDKMGSNKSKSVLNKIMKIYLSLLGDNGPDEIFNSTCEKVASLVARSSNFEEIPIDELELAVDILVVDAFVRCKIFENPPGYSYAVT
jgi:hypothetical protein